LHYSVSPAKVSHRTYGERINVPDERSWSAAGSKQADVVYSDNDQMITARRVAEALFKPRAQAKPAERSLPVTDVPAPSEQPSQRKPRILVSTQPDFQAGTEAPASPANATQAAAKAERASKIPAGQYRRIRTLATYGMTLEQVADLYSASLGEVRRIVGKGSESHRS